MARIDALDPKAFADTFCPFLLLAKIMDATSQFRAFLDRVIMQPHSESYRGWQIVVEVSGNSFIGEGDQSAPRYIPSIVAIEPLSIDFAN